MVNRDWPPHLSSSSLSTSSPFPGSLTHIIAISHTFAHCCHHFSLISYTSSVNIHHVIALSHTFWSILAKRRFNYLHSCILSLHLSINFFQTSSPLFVHFCHFFCIVDQEQYIFAFSDQKCHFVLDVWLAFRKYTVWWSTSLKRENYLKCIFLVARKIIIC